jgi:hypothetical protein
LSIELVAERHLRSRHDEADAVTAGWRVKYDGTCSRCGIALRAGEVAVYDRPTRTIHCVVCPVDDSRTALGPEPVVSHLDAGVAGASALREYERRKLSRETRIKGRLGDRLGRVVLAVTAEPQSTRSWATGARGEEKLAAALDGIPGVRALHDRRVPGRRSNIDHIVVAPAGVFVVDAKHYQGTVRIRNRGGIFRSDHRLYVGRRDCSKLTAGFEWQIAAVEAVLKLNDTRVLPRVTPVLCFVDAEWPIFSAPASYAGVRITSPKSLQELVTALPILEPAEVDALWRLLGQRLPPKVSARVQG